jgi:PEP-CTERM motif
LSQLQLNTIASLVVNGNVAVQGGASASDSAAYQVAIWSVEYGSNFSYESFGNAFSDQVSNFIQAADVGSAPSGYSFSIFNPIDPAVSQTLVFATPIARTTAVPEASTWAMMLAGFGGLGVVAFRRARKPQISALA